MRIGRDRQRQPAQPSLVRCFLDQRRADSTSPHVRLDEQSVELSADYRRKARDPSIELGDEHLPVGDLRRRKVDRVGVRLELRAIVLVRQ